MDAISAVQIERAGFGYKAIRFSVAGGSTAPHVTGLGSYGAASTDPFALPFPSRKRSQFEELASAVLAARGSLRTPLP